MAQLAPYRSSAGLMSLILLSACFTTVVSFNQRNVISPHSNTKLHEVRHFSPTFAKPNNDNDINTTSSSTSSNRNQSSRREALQKSLTFGMLTATSLLASTPILSSAAAKNYKSRTEGYAIQHTDAEWSSMLSSMQYFILRQGGTESPYSSILEGEERSGMYVCAGCKTPLFDAKEKFHSGTGWPSFASPVKSETDPPVSNVEMEEMSKIQFQLAGAEARCQSCGGHLGDVFADGFLFPGTPAMISGRRYCMDGAALLFVPKDQNGGGADGELEVVSGDLPPKSGGRGPVFPG